MGTGTVLYQTCLLIQAGGSPSHTRAVEEALTAYRKPKPLKCTLRKNKIFSSTLLCTDKTLRGSAVSLPHVSQLLEVKSLCGLTLPMLKDSSPAPESNLLVDKTLPCLPGHVDVS